MKKRKFDPSFEQSSHFRDHDKVKNRALLPLLYNEDHIDFRYHDEYEQCFPTNLSNDIIKLIVDYNCAYDMLKNRSLNTGNLCCICGTADKVLNMHDVRCSRCLCYFCEFCWLKSNFIPQVQKRLLWFGYDRLAKGYNDSDKKFCLYVQYNYCPGCCAGLKFDDTIL